MNRMAWRAAIMAVLVPLLLFVPAHRAARASCTAFPYVGVLAAGPNGSLLAGTLDGHIYRGVTGAGCWVSLSTYPTNVEIGILVVPPGRPHTILAGGSFTASTTPESRVLYRSEDDGQTWVGATSGLPHTAILPVSIAASPRGTLVLSFWCAQDWQFPGKKPVCPQGLARSVDGGRSWHPVGPPARVTRNTVALPDGTFLALLAPQGKQAHSPGTPYPGSIYRSVDDGLTWQPVAVRSGTEHGNALFNLAGISTFFATPWRPTDLFIGGDLDYFTANAYRSLDDGEHWSMVWSARKAKVTNALAEPMVVSFAALPRTHTLLFSDLGFIYRSVDGGAVWTRAEVRPSTHASSGYRFWSLLAAPDGVTAYAGAVTGIYRSGDDGKTWAPLL